MTTNYDKLRDSLKRLEERYRDHEAALHRPELLPSDRESIRESCIQRFEVCFDTTWKHLKKYLEEEIGLPEVPAGPNPLFRKAMASDVIADAELWIAFSKRRNDTSHDYSGTKAESAFAILPDFIAEAIALYEKMSGTPWPH